MIADGFDAFLLDLDGVLFRGSEPIDGAAETVERLRARGASVVFVTNNSARTPQEVADHLGAVGVAALAQEVETSALTTAAVLAERGIREALVIGERGLREALTARGISLVDDGAEVVVVGWDRGVDYDRLRAACIAVQRGAALIASNPDTSYPAADGTRWPGAGAILAAVEVTCGVRAEVIGKPNAPILEAALRRAGGGTPLVVGDRLDTDIAGAAGLGWASALVLTGISSEADLEDSLVRPTFVLDDLRGLFSPA